jgi:hypothetical protein
MAYSILRQFVAHPGNAALDESRASTFQHYMEPVGLKVNGAVIDGFAGQSEPPASGVPLESHAIRLCQMRLLQQ